MTALLAARIAAPSSPVRASTEFATFENWRLRFGDLAFFVNREAWLGVHGIANYLLLLRQDVVLRLHRHNMIATHFERLAIGLITDQAEIESLDHMNGRIDGLVPTQNAEG